MNEKITAAPAVESQKPPSRLVLRVENILVKNLSLEIPEKVVTPSFKEEPIIEMELRNFSRRLNREDCYEVTLEAVMRLQSGDQVQMLIELTQAGVVVLQHADERQRREFLNIHAPEMLYPYTSQLVGDLVMRAGGPRVFLPPFNFRAMYEKKRRAIQQTIDENGRPAESMTS